MLIWLKKLEHCKPQKFIIAYNNGWRNYNASWYWHWKTLISPLQKSCFLEGVDIENLTRFLWVKKNISTFYWLLAWWL